MFKTSEIDNTFVPKANLIYKISPQYAPNLCFEIKDGNTDNGENLQLGESKEVPYQYFKIIPVEKSKVCIEPVHCPDKVIDICQGKMKNKTNIQLFSRLNTGQQYFHIIKVGNDTYTILSCVDENFVVDINHYGKKKGTNIQLYQRNNTKAQILKIEGKRNIFYSIDYALLYSTKRNPDYKVYEPNCANFCSQCLIAGGSSRIKLGIKTPKRSLIPQN